MKVDNFFAMHNGIDGLLKQVQKATGSDEKVIAGIDAFVKELCIQIFNIHLWFDSQKVAIGGGISAQPLLFELIHQNIDEMYEQAVSDDVLSRL